MKQGYQLFMTEPINIFYPLASAKFSFSPSNTIHTNSPAGRALDML
jgi:hypothetical protein